jgi:hypothetical protein
MLVMMDVFMIMMSFDARCVDMNGILRFSGCLYFPFYVRVCYSQLCYCLSSSIVSGSVKPLLDLSPLLSNEINVSLVVAVRFGDLGV